MPTAVLVVVEELDPEPVEVVAVPPPPQPTAVKTTIDTNIATSEPHLLRYGTTRKSEQARTAPDPRPYAERLEVVADEATTVCDLPVVLRALLCSAVSVSVTSVVPPAAMVTREDGLNA